MSVTYGFYDSLNGDRKYSAKQISELFDGLIGDGVFTSIGDALAVSVGGGMNIIVGTGRAWFNHTWTYNDAPLILQVDQSEIALNRVDSVVLEVNSDDDVRANTIKIVKGVPSSEPVATELVRNEFVNQYPLAYIYVSAGVTEITSANIENTIGSSDCPFVTGILETVDIDTLLAQWDGEFHDWMQQLEDILDEDTAGNLLNLIEAHKAENTSHVRYGVASGTNAKTITLNPAPSSLVEGLALSFKNSTTNTGAATLNVNGLGAKPIVKSNGSAVSSGNLKSGSIYTVRYDGSSFILQGEGGEYGTAQAQHVLSPYTIGTENGIVQGTIPSKGPQIYIPGTTDQAIAANQYLTGIQTIKGDPNHLAENIKRGVTMWGKTGTLMPAANVAKFISSDTATIRHSDHAQFNTPYNTVSASEYQFFTGGTVGCRFYYGVDFKSGYGGDFRGYIYIHVNGVVKLNEYINQPDAANEQYQSFSYFRSVAINAGDIVKLGLKWTGDRDDVFSVLCVADVLYDITVGNSPSVVISTP